MMSSDKCASCGPRGWINILARVLIAAVFIYAGYGKVTNVAGTAAYIASVGLPYATVLAWSAGVLELVAGLLIVVGYFRRWAAWALIAFTLIATYFFHTKGAMAGDATQIIMTLKNLGLIGGLILVGGCSICGSCANCGREVCVDCGGPAKEGENKCENCR